MRVEGQCVFAQSRNLLLRRDIDPTGSIRKGCAVTESHEAQAVTQHYLSVTGAAVTHSIPPDIRLNKPSHMILLQPNPIFMRVLNHCNGVTATSEAGSRDMPFFNQHCGLLTPKHMRLV